MRDQTVRSGTRSAIQESLNVYPEDWHGFCLGFSTGHMGWGLTLREVDTAELDHEPIRTRQQANPTLEEAFFRQITYDTDAKRLRFAYFHEGAEREWSLEQPEKVLYERIRGDEKELRIDVQGGTTALVQLKFVETPERLGVVDDKEPGC